MFSKIDLGITENHQCAECGGKNYHANITWFSNGQWLYDDIGIWCQDCEQETSLTESE